MDSRDQALPVTRCILPRSGRHRLAAALSLLSFFGLAGCNTDYIRARDRGVEANTTRPVSYKADILAFMQTYLNDPRGVREAFVSEPVLRSLENIERYSACLRYTARKPDGQYAPSKDSLVLFRDGRLDRIVDNARETCKDAAYQPFRGVERLSR